MKPVSIVLTGFFALAVLAALHVAANLVVPIALAMLLNLLLSPLVKKLSRRGLPPAISSLILVASIVGCLAFAVARLAEPASDWIDEAPHALREIQAELFAAQDRLSGIQEIADEVDELTAVDSPPVQKVEVTGPGFLENVVGQLPAIATFCGIVIFLTFFLLASGDTMLRRITHCGRTWTERRRIVAIARQIEIDLSHYLSTVTIINFALACAVALAMHWLQVPNPLLWGAMAGVFNFAPYVGAMASAAVLTVVGITSFDTLAEALAVPIALLALTVMEGQLLTPAVLGRRLALHPLIVFMSIVFWGWLWGLAGALMAVPIVTCLKVFADHVPRLNFVARFIRKDTEDERVAVKSGVRCKSFKRKTDNILT